MPNSKRSTVEIMAQAAALSTLTKYSTTLKRQSSSFSNSRLQKSKSQTDDKSDCQFELARGALRKVTKRMKKSAKFHKKLQWPLLALVILGLHTGMRAQAAEELNKGVPGTPSFEDYATIEAYVDGFPVYSLGNIAYIYGVSPDLLPGAVMQQGNNNPKIKIRPKKSWEIKRNLFVGSMDQPGVRTMWNDNQPLL